VVVLVFVQHGSVLSNGQLKIVLVVAVQSSYEHVAVLRVQVPDGPIPGRVVTNVGQLRGSLPVMVLTEYE
jgi:hypothetical protein